MKAKAILQNLKLYQRLRRGEPIQLTAAEVNNIINSTVDFVEGIVNRSQINGKWK